MSLPEDAIPRRSDIDWRWAIPRIALVFIVTRLLVLAVAVVAEATQQAPPGVVRIDERPILTSLTLWDGEFYVGIAESGYHVEFETFPDYAFYPGFPIAVRAVSFLTFGDVALASVLAANAAFALGLIVLFALSVRYLTPARAILSLWFLALAPPNFVFAMSYSESLFFVLAVSAFLAAEARRPWLAGLAVAAAALTRAPGILLCLPLLALYVERDGWRAFRQWIPLLLVAAALAAFFGYLWWLTGDPLAPVHAQGYWNLPEPDAAVAPGASSGALDIAPTVVVAYWVGSMAFYLFLFVFFRHDRVRPAYWLVSLMAVLSVFLSGRLQSAPRYIAGAWPFAWVLAGRRSVVGRGAVMAAFAAAQVVLMWLAFTWSVPP